MKFLRYLNPFYVARVIRELREDLADEQAYISTLLDRVATLRSVNNTLTESRDDWEDLARDTVRAWVQLDQATDAFMAEREDLKVELEVAHMAGLMLTETAMTQQATIQEQAGEIVEIVSYVKQVEEALRVNGVSIEDGEIGPAVVVNQDVFLQRLAEGAFNVVREEAQSEELVGYAAAARP